MAKTNAERVKAWRERQLADPEKAEAYRAKRADQARKRKRPTDGVTAHLDRVEIERLTQEVERLRAEKGEAITEGKAHLWKSVELTKQLENLRKYNKGLNTQIQNLTISLNSYAEQRRGHRRVPELT